MRWLNNGILMINKKKKTIYIADGIEFDSNEEVMFYRFLLELQDRGYIHKFDYHTETIHLLDKVGYEKKDKKGKSKMYHLLNGMDYTPDFIIYPTDKFIRFADVFKGYHINKEKIFIDVKGAFAQNHMNISFSLKQKFVYYKYKIYIEKCIPDKIFKKCFVPVCFKLTPTGKPANNKWSRMLSYEEKYGYELF